MTSDYLAVILIALVAGYPSGGSVPVPHTSTPDAQPLVRRIYASREPLASRLLPNDQTVIVQRLETPSVAILYDSPPLPVEELSRLAGQADAVLVVDVLSVSSELINQGSWIRTHVSVRAHEIVKQAAKPLVAGNGIVTFEYDGGELVINGVTVKAGN